MCACSTVPMIIRRIAGILSMSGMLEIDSPRFRILSVHFCKIMKASTFKIELANLPAPGHGNLLFSWRLISYMSRCNIMSNVTCSI